MGQLFGPTAYVSYARKDEYRTQIVSELKQSLEAEGISLLVDTDTVKPRQSFGKFINELATADCVFLVLSKNYFRSFFCMLEFARILKAGNLQHRISVILVDDDFSFNVIRKECPDYWQQRVASWHNNDNEEPDEGEECGTEAESLEILESLYNIGENDSLFSEVSYQNAVRPVDDQAAIAKWINDEYIERIRNTQLFKPVDNHLRSCNEGTKKALWKEMGDDLRDKPVEAIGCLIQTPLPDLIALVKRTRKNVKRNLSGEILKQSQRELSDLLKHVLPLLYSPDYVRGLRLKCGNEPSLIEIPFATSLSAETLMAAVDQRPADFRYRKISDISNEFQLYPGQYNLRLPPESGEGANQMMLDMEDDLFRRIGTDATVSEIAEDVDLHLFGSFAHKQGGRSYRHEQKRILAQRAFKKNKQEGEPGYYWILPLGEHTSRQRWEQLANHINQYYPEITLLSLDDDFDKELEEGDLFQLLDDIIPC